MDRKIDEEQSPRHTLEGPLHTLGLAHQPHEQIVLGIGRLMRYLPRTQAQWFDEPADRPSHPHTLPSSRIVPQLSV